MNKNHRFSLSSKTFDISHSKLYEQRAKKINLVWCSQVASIIQKKLISEKILLNDLGCNYFQLYKEFKRRNLNYNYKGYDIDKKYIDIGLNIFPEMKNKYKIMNIENNKPRICDVSVSSAILEHTINPEKFLNNIIYTTKKFVILRTYLGNENIFELYGDKKNVTNPYYINQFSFKYLIDFFHKNKFNLEFHQDIATSCSLKYELFKDSKIFRSMYILVATKNT